MEPRVLEILKSYSRGNVSALEAATAISSGANVGDVFALTREAKLPFPNPDGPFEQSEFEKAKRLFARLRKTAGGKAA
jgi:hypothetical protein